MPKPWATSASASIAGADGIVTLVEGSAFCISSRSGEIDPIHPHGLFFRDTRFLSEMHLTLNGAPPEPLAATAADPFSGMFVLRALPSAGLADSHLVLYRRRYVGRGMREDLEIQNFGVEAAFCSIEIVVDADFADVFEVKESRVHKHGQLGVEVEGSRVTFNYKRHSFVRATHVDFGPEARINGGHVIYETVVPPRGTWSTCIGVTPVIGDYEVTPRYQCGQPVERSTPVVRLSEWKSRMPVVTADHEQFRELLARSTADLAGLRIFDPEYPDRAVVAAGAPWFMTLFGRDSLITSWMTMLVDPDLALGTLQTLARFQGKEVDVRTEEEPGRILHEMRFGETASLALGGGRIYYGSVDAAPLFVMLLGELSRWGNRREEVDALLPAADAALQWITDYGDKDGDGYVEYQRMSDRGLQNQGWKDSWDSMRFADGSHAATPIALCEVQGYVYAALIARSHTATEAGDDDFAASLDRARPGAQAPVQRGLLGGDRRRRVLRDRARPRQEAHRRRRFRPGSLSLDRHRRRGEGPARRALVALARDVQWVGDPHAVRGQRRVQPALVPLRKRVAARQRVVRGGIDAVRVHRRGAPRDARRSSTRRLGSATCCPSCSAACRARDSVSP